MKKELTYDRVGQIDLSDGRDVPVSSLERIIEANKNKGATFADVEVDRYGELHLIFYKCRVETDEEARKRIAADERPEKIKEERERIRSEILKSIEH